MGPSHAVNVRWHPPQCPWALIKVLDKQRLDPTTSVGRGFIAFLSAMAEDERQRILKRANGGRAAARKRGAKFGRKANLTDQHQAEALERLAAIGKTMGVHHAMIASLAA